MLPVEEGGPGDARQNGPGEDPAPPDLPVAVVLELVGPPHPAGDAVNPKLAPRAESATVAGPEVGRRPGGEDRRDGRRLRGEVGERRVRLLRPTIVRFPAHLRPEWRAGHQAGEPERNEGRGRLRQW